MNTNAVEKDCVYVFARIRRLADKLLDLHTYKSEQMSFVNRITEAHPFTHHVSNGARRLVDLPIALVYQALSFQWQHVVIQSRGVRWKDNPGLPLLVWNII